MLDTDSNIIISIASIVTIISAISSFLIIAFVIWYRGYIERINKRRERVNTIWQEALYTVVGVENNSLASMPAEDLLPDNKEAEERKFFAIQTADKESSQIEFIKPQEIPHFLFIWNYLHESLNGNANKSLNTFAKKLEIKEKALKLLNSHILKNRLLAINTLGNLGAKDTYKDISKFVTKNDPVISVWAYKAMFRIRPIKTSKSFLHLIALRKDWSPAHIAKILSECRTDILSKNLTEMVWEYYEWDLEEKQLARLVSFLRFAYEKDYEKLIEQILSECDKMEVLIATISLVNSQKSLPKIRKFLYSEHWQLRMYAVKTLGRLGEEKDEQLLISALGDRDWWVRYHSARSLISMPTITHQKLETLAETLPDEFQRDILTQVLAEEEFKCQNLISTM